MFKIILACAGFVVTEAAFLDSISKCSIRDNECLKNTYQKGIVSIGKTGIPEYGIPPIDPLALKDINISMAGLLDMVLMDGVGTGIAGCRYQEFSVDIEKATAKIKFACDITIEGKYKISSSSPIIKSLLNGSSIRGEGNGKIVFEKLIMRLDFPLYAVKRDGEIYIKYDFKAGKYNYEVGKMKFEADNLYLGDKEASKQVVNVMNNNWKFIVDSMGRPFADKAIDIYGEYMSKFFDKVPAQNFITDDLSPFVKS